MVRGAALMVFHNGCAGSERQVTSVRPREPCLRCGPGSAAAVHGGGSGLVVRLAFKTSWGPYGPREVRFLHAPATLPRFVTRPRHGEAPHPTPPHWSPQRTSAA